MRPADAGPARLGPGDRRRLVGALNLLASPVDGEVLGAARGALRILRAAGLSWADVIPEGEPERGHPHEPRDDDAGEDWRALAAELLRRQGEMFDAAELAFLRDIVGFRRLSPRQAAWLRRLAERARGAARAA